MKIGLILNTNDAETCWNCFRFGNEAISKNHSMTTADAESRYAKRGVLRSPHFLLIWESDRQVRLSGVSTTAATILPATVSGRRGRSRLAIAATAEFCRMMGFDAHCRSGLSASVSHTTPLTIGCAWDGRLPKH